jgi:hypothetical protein
MTCCDALVQNLNDHLSDPSAINAFNYATKFTCVLVLFTVTSIQAWAALQLCVLQQLHLPARQRL